MKIAAFDGSPRRNGNSSLLLQAFLEVLRDNNEINFYKTDNLDLKPCRGCLMCNVLQRCAIKKDDWAEISSVIESADILVFSSPVYFHHTTSSMKKLLDRFRSFIKVRITEESIIHTTHMKWNKKLFLFTAHGSSSPDDAQPLVDLFEFMTDILGPENELKYINALRLAFSGQIGFDKQQLTAAYKKLELPLRLIDEDLEQNTVWLEAARSFAGEINV